MNEQMTIDDKSETNNYERCQTQAHTTHLCDVFILFSNWKVKSAHKRKLWGCEHIIWFRSFTHLLAPISISLHYFKINSEQMDKYRNKTSEYLWRGERVSEWAIKQVSEWRLEIKSCALWNWKIFSNIKSV